MIHALVDLGDKVVPLKGKDFRELQARIERARSAPQRDEKTIVLRSGERICVPDDEAEGH